MLGWRGKEGGGWFPSVRKFSVVAPRSVDGGASEDCGACLVTLDKRAEDDGGDQGGEQQAAKNPLWKKGSP